MKGLSGLILVLTILFVASCAPPSVVIPTPAPPTSAPTQAAATGPVPPATATGSPSTAPSETPAPTAALPEAPAPGMPSGSVSSAVGAETYSSPTLGISFSYLPRQNDQTIKVLEQGDKIYVYPANMEPTAGQYLQVFQKRPDESLVDAITRLIMPGHPAADCKVVPVANPIGGGTPPANFQYAGIVVRREPGEDENTILARWRTCPQPYTVVGGIGYFQADTQHPDKFIFLNIGQYGILAARDVPWQETIEFR